MTTNPSLDIKYYECSACGARMKETDKFCPKCGPSFAEKIPIPSNTSSTKKPEYYIGKTNASAISSTINPLTTGIVKGKETVHMSYCPNCGTKIESIVAKFCHNCGQSFNTTNDKSAQLKTVTLNNMQRHDSGLTRLTTHPIFRPTIRIREWIQSLSNMSFGIILVMLLIPLFKLLQIQLEYIEYNFFIFFWNGSHRIFLLIAFIVILRYEVWHPFIIGVYLFLLLGDFTGYVLQNELESIGRGPELVGVPSLINTYAALIIGSAIVIAVSLKLLSILKSKPKVVSSVMGLTIFGHLFCKFIMWTGTNQKDTIDMSHLPSTLMQDAIVFEQNVSFVLIVYFILSFISAMSSNNHLTRVNK